MLPAGLICWRSAPTDLRLAAQNAIAAIVEQRADSLVSLFYGTFLDHPEAQAFLSHDVVQQRLGKSMRNWLLELVRLDPLGDLAAFDARQFKIGEVHARLKIPNHLVMEGCSVIKSEVGEALIAGDLPRDTLGLALILLSEIVDYAMRQMSEAYASNSQRRDKADEAYRLFSLGQDVSLERETQRAALMEWSQSVLFGLVGRSNAGLATIAASPFGLWLRHRASMLFHGTILDDLLAICQRIDGVHLPALALAASEAGALSAPIAAFQADMNEIQFLMSELFQSAQAMDNGRDPLTRTLNRRFLAPILGREVTLARDGGVPLTVLMVDVDHFKAINDAHGHQAGDQVLRQVADFVLDAVRFSDFVFRYGGEEFLVALVETPMSEAMQIAERLRRHFEDHAVALPDRTQLAVSVSIGVASFEGHPDYEYLIRAADEALYRAKTDGRNRVVAAG